MDSLKAELAKTQMELKKQKEEALQAEQKWTEKFRTYASYTAGLSNKLIAPMDSEDSRVATPRSTRNVTNSYSTIPPVAIPATQVMQGKMEGDSFPGVPSSFRAPDRASDHTSSSSAVLGTNSQDDSQFSGTSSCCVFTYAE